ncbi:MULTISPECIES: ABC transporter ATP-binding protein [Actinoalloteichus]|uniref:ABC-type multidrug transport system, ATPase and permease component n=1 Tax=Actinoalloteichus fjordicus TaxID=1612552 RepID=A0AAC9LC17_9PSEU|nr:MULTISPECIES: ABC transporter ATP-binding protein [Actinoalloteichus]APU15028.1 ABC-type multidrug transport system, ATPase and permease component [Actinoalloteichus fjordicus]APU21096.1 ABC-type multidrug transport system, ATPase and permease component [Actinoalloteichus sp. GBA129-24]
MSSSPADGRLPVADAPAVGRATWDLLRHDRRALVIVITLTFLAAAAGLAAPRLLGEIVDRVEAGEGTAVLDLLAAALVAFAVAQFLLTRLAYYAAHRFAERALARLRERFVDRTLALPTSVVEHAGSGDLMTRSSTDVATLGTTLRDAGPGLFLSAVQVLLILGAITLLDPLFGLCALVGAPVIGVVARWYLRRARTAYLTEGHATSAVSESLAATADGAATVESLRLRRRRITEGDRRVADSYDAKNRTLRLRTVLYPVLEFSYGIPLAVILLVGGVRYLEGTIGIGTVIAGGLYILQLTEPLDRVLIYLEQLQRSGASLARIEGVALAAGTAPVHTETAPADDRIEVVGVSHSYVEGRDVLIGIDLAVRPGERLALVGPSGAGKSTLGRLLAGIDAPRTGSITVGGVPVARLGPAELRRRVVLVTQEHHVFLGTLRDNLSIAAPEAADTTLRAALAAVDAHWVDDLPAGLDTRLDTPGAGLDAARSQQIALARVVLADPHTVILDEATALLDPTTARHAERSLAAVLAGRTVIAIAHRLHTAHDADRVAVLDGGRITELGSHEDLLDADGPYAALWRSWHGPQATHRWSEPEAGRSDDRDREPAS